MSAWLPCTTRRPDCATRWRHYRRSTARQLIHNDYRASNVLTAGSEILAVIDFDEVVLDHCVTDIANAFVHLGTHFTDWQPTPPCLRDALLEGYESVRPLSTLEHGWLHALALWRGIAAVPAGPDPAGWANALHGMPGSGDGDQVHR